MGLRGLPHYIGQTCRGVFREGVPLRNTRVIIDGNNFFRTFPLQLRKHEDPMLAYGCNYDTFYFALDNFFEKLRKCKLEPVMIFVGTTSCQEVIFERVKLRNQQTIDRLQEFIQCGYSIRLHNLPRALMAKTLIVRYMNDHHIHHLTMDYEEDDQIAALANRWQCPIMTADSDFYCYEYIGEARVIPIYKFDLLIFRQDAKGYFLQTQSYQTKDFANYHNITDATLISLFAAIVIEKDINDNFLDILPLQTEERDRELKALLGKIREASREKTLEEILDNLDSCFEDLDEDIHDKIRNKRQEFLLKEPKEEYYTFVEEIPLVIKSNVKTKAGKSLPDWFIQAFRGSGISRYFVGILARRATSLYTQLEDIESPSPHECASDIRAIMWGILVKYDDNFEPHVMEFFRESNQVLQRTTTPVFHVDDYGPVPDLELIPELPAESTTDFMMKSLRLQPSIFEGIRASNHMFILATKYWLVQTNPDLSYLRALILCYIKLGIVPKSLSDALGLQSLSLDDEEESDDWGVYPSEWKTVNRKLQSNANIPAIKLIFIKNTPDRIRIHQVFAEWLTIYSEIYRLNNLLCNPFMEMGPEQCFRGSFVFTYNHCFSRCDNPEAIIRQILGKSIYDNVYMTMWNTLMNNQ